MQKPIITIKNLEHVARLSEDTHCFAASLYVDGKKVGTVRNAGHGGPDELNLLPNCGWTENSLETAIKATYPKWGSKFSGNGVDDMDTTLDIVVGNLVNKHLLLKAIKKDFKSKVCVLDESGILDNYSFFKLKGVKVVDAKILEHFNKAKPELVSRVLNTKSDDELLSLMKDD